MKTILTSFMKSVGRRKQLVGIIPPNDVLIIQRAIVHGLPVLDFRSTCQAWEGVDYFDARN